MNQRESAVGSTQAIGRLPHAIVVGLDDIRGVHAARTLAGYKIPVIGIARDPKSFGCKTNVCERILYADTRTDDFVSLLEQLGPSLTQKAALVPCLDMAALQVSRHRDRLREWYAFTMAEPDVIEMMSDKVLFYDYAGKAGLPIPKTRFIKCRSDVDKAAAELRFPCAVKPPNSKDPAWLAHTHIKAFKASSAEDLLSIFDTWHKLATPLVVQEWIEGPEENLFACHCYLNADADPLVTFTSRKLRQWPPNTGQACLAEECRADHVREITIELFRQTGFVGLGYVEIKQDDVTDEYLIVEPNVGRVSGRMAIVEAGGVDLLYTMYCECIGLPLPENRRQTYGNAKWIYLRQDFQSTLAGLRNRRLTPRKWYQSWRGRKKFALLSWRDPGPFVADIFNGLRLLKSKSERRKRSSESPESTA
jgi:D-aspartate ligase